MTFADLPHGSVTDNGQEWITWVHPYDGYTLLARGPDELEEVLAPARQEFAATGAAPEWCGTHLLRG